MIMECDVEHGSESVNKYIGQAHLDGISGHQAVSTNLTHHGEHQWRA